MIGVEKEVSELCERADLMRRALYNCLTSATKDRNDPLAEAHFQEMRRILREFNTMVEDTRRKRDQLRAGPVQGGEGSAPASGAI